jgi:hypothetical protein
MQPVVDPAQSLELIKASASFVVLFHLAPWKNDDRAAEVNWPQFCAEAKMLFRKLGKPYSIE